MIVHEKAPAENVRANNPKPGVKPRSLSFYVLLAAALFIFIRTFPALSPIFLLYPVAVMFSMLLCVEAFGVLGVLVAAPMVAIVEILHDELYRKRFLPSVMDADLDRLARNALREKRSAPK